MDIFTNVKFFPYMGGSQGQGDFETRRMLGKGGRGDSPPPPRPENPLLIFKGGGIPSSESLGLAANDQKNIFLFKILIAYFFRNSKLIP